MKQKKNEMLLSFLFVMFVFVGCKAQDTVVDEPGWAFAENLTVTKEFDTASNTTYYLTRIKHKDKNGNIIKLRTEFANRPEGESTRNFAIRKNSAVAINASQGLNNLPDNVRQPTGVQIIDGKIIQDLNSTAYTLGIKDNNELLAYRPGTKAQAILNDGTKNALTAFVPLIENHEMVSD